MRVHSCFSLGYGILKPEELVAWALQHGHQQLLLTDINNTGSGLAFARAAQEQGLEPLLGLELRNGLQQVATIIARNNFGFQELNTFLTQHLLAAKPFEKPLPPFANCWVWYPFNQHPTHLQAHEFVAIEAQQILQWQRQKRAFAAHKYVADIPMSFRHKRDHNTHRLLRAISSNCLLSKLPTHAQAPTTERLSSAWQCSVAFAAAPELLANTQRIYRHMSSLPLKPSKYYSGSGKSAPLLHTNMLPTSP
jgi:DNA polymerase-3 subunit alpha